LSTADLRKRLDELINIGGTLTSDKIKADKRIAPNVTKWTTQCQIVLEKAFGNNNIFLTDFQKILKQYFHYYHVDHGVALLEAAKEELDLNGKSTKLDEIETEIKEGEAEAKRRETVAESKFWGSVIELIQLQRDELKRRSQVDQEIAEIRKEITDLRLLLTKLIPEENKQNGKS